MKSTNTVLRDNKTRHTNLVHPKPDKSLTKFDRLSPSQNWLKTPMGESSRFQEAFAAGRGLSIFEGIRTLNPSAAVEMIIPGI